MGSFRQLQDIKLAIPISPENGDADHDIDPLNPIEAKRITSKSLKFKAPEFKYVYSDTDATREELEEWFAYSDMDLLEESRVEFSKLFAGEWKNLHVADRERLVGSLISSISKDSNRERALLQLFYVALGVYNEFESDESQLTMISDNAVLLWRSGAVQLMYELIWKLLSEIYTESADTERLQLCRKELFLSLTILYFQLENIKSEEFCDDLARISPSILAYFIKQIGAFRVHIADDAPWRNILLLTWKLILRILGNSEDLINAKEYARKLAGLPPEGKKDAISASPLDYQVFRQGISSRYPGYQPPSQVLPREFPYACGSAASSTSSLADYAVDPLPGSSVHIATPAPSPPLSPPPTGKSKKSAFHTDQSFPFIYPQSVEVPVSIREAEEIFLQRMRTSLGILQLWNEREEFMKQERGWIAADELALEDDAVLTDFESSSAKRLARVERLYKDVLEDLQSFVVVMLKLVLSTVSPESVGDFLKRQQFLNGQSEAIDPPNMAAKSELENARETEIMLKAISGIIYLLFKWFKVSHILKFEFLSQLLYDSNVLPLFLQLFNTKGIEQFVLQIPEVPALKFFSVCRTLAAGGDLPDREIAIAGLEENGNEKTIEEILQQDEVTEFSHRNFFVYINLLKIMQKICKNKAHRNLTVVQLKASNSLRKTLRISQYDARLYALKIIKGQVPYCGRKWRQVNMRVITAIYLYCRQELRDSWLAGVDIDADVEDSYPREVALRALIQFYNTRRYPDAAIVLGYRNTEEDFFAKELEGLLVDDSVHIDRV